MSPLTQLNKHSRQVASHGSEVFYCLALGLKDALHPKLAFLSLMIGVSCFLVYLLLFWLYWDGIWSNIQAVTRYLLSHGVDWLTAIPYFDLFLSISLLLVGFVLLVILSSRLILDTVLMPIIQTHVLRRYPELSKEHESGIWAGIVNALKMLMFSILALPLLIIPVFGAMLFFLAVAFLNMRGLCFDVLDGVASPKEIEQIVHSKAKPAIALGAITGIFPLIPLLGLLTPVILGASATHYFFRRLCELRASAAEVKVESPISAVKLK